MKILKLSFLALAICVGVIACDKNSDATTNEVSEVVDSDTEYEYDEDEPLPYELEERAASLTGAAVQGAGTTTVTSADDCHNVKHEGFQIIPNGSITSWQLTGTELGAAQTLNALKGSASVTGYVKAIVYQSTPAFNKAKTDTVNCNVSSWSPTAIVASVPPISFDSLRTFYVKFIVGYPVQAKDSSVVSIKEKKKSIKCIGKYQNARYGTFNWNVAMLARYGNVNKLPVGMTVKEPNPNSSSIPIYGNATNLAIDSTGLTQLEAGDIVERADGTQGLVYGVNTRDPKKGYKVRIQQIVCAKASTKTGTWTFNFPLGFKAKADETGGSWTKFKRRSNQQ